MGIAKNDRGLEDIKTFFSKIIIKVIILMKEITHIQKIIIAHILDIFWGHSFWWILNILLSEFLDEFFFHSVVFLRFLVLVYHSGGRLWKDMLCGVVFLHSLSVHFIERNSLVVMIDFQ